ncbi:MAG: hypothetical protein ACR2NZ_21445 [Rubripirellula sp.]
MNRNVQYFTLSIAAFALLLSGCDSDPPEARLAVRGQVTLDGKPLNQVSVRFVPKGEERGSAARVENGKFTMNQSNGPTAGDFIIVISPLELEFDQAMSAITAGQHDPLGTSRIPTRYQRPGYLTACVRPDSLNDFRFNLKSR